MLNKVCFEQKVARRAQSFPLKGNRRDETLRRLSKSKISEEITRGVHRSQAYSKSQSSGGIALAETQLRPKIVGFAGESSKAETFEYPQTLPSRKESKAQEEERQKSSDLLWGGAWTIRSMSRKAKESVEEEQIPSIGSKHEGPTTVGSKG
jgi:hypothetical protein